MAGNPVFCNDMRTNFPSPSWPDPRADHDGLCERIKPNTGGLDPAMTKVRGRRAHQSRNVLQEPFGGDFVAVAGGLGELVGAAGHGVETVCPANCRVRNKVIWSRDRRPRLVPPRNVFEIDHPVGHGDAMAAAVLALVLEAVIMVWPRGIGQEFIGQIELGAALAVPARCRSGNRLRCDPELPGPGCRRRRY